MKDSSTDPVLDASVIQELKSLQRPGRPDVFRSLVVLYLETADESAEAIRVAIQEKDMQALSDAAHSLKSSSANVGALRLSRVCLELEKIGDGVSVVEGLEKQAQEFSQELQLALAELRKVGEGQS